MIFIASASYVVLEFRYLVSRNDNDTEFNNLIDNNRMRRIIGALMSVVSVFFMTSVL